METISFDASRRRVAVGSWTRRANRVEPTADGEMSALLGLVKDRKLLITGRDGDRRVFVELWTGEPDESDGLAVAVEEDSVSGVVRIPLCGCGDRGCGNAGVQLATDLEVQYLGTLVELLSTLPVLPGPPIRDLTWDGEMSDAGPVIE